MHEYKKISEEDFWKRLHDGESDFSFSDFDFEISFNDWDEIKQELDFGNSIFRKKIKFVKTIFRKKVNFDNAIFEDEADFYRSDFYSVFSLNHTQFKKNVIFNNVIFYSDFIANKSIFFEKAYFQKTKFYKTSIFQYVDFYDKADFSYAHFPTIYLNSFVSINKRISKPVLFIMRNILFPENTVFTDIDLRRTIFQDSLIEKIIFKDCVFTKKNKRYVFYPEVANEKSFKVSTSKLNQFKNEIYNTIIFKKENFDCDFNISDRIILYSDELVAKKIKYFIVTKFKFKNYQEAEETIKKINEKRGYFGVEKIRLDMDGFDFEYEGEVVVLRLKEFNEIKNWSVLEDLYRQMKKSLEDSKDWLSAGEFYKSEMIAKMNFLALKGESFWYRMSLIFYRWVSYFGESVFRIIMTIFVSGALMEGVLKLFRPDLSYFKIFSINLSLFIPIFGSNTLDTVKSLELSNWQNVILYISITWFYILWLILAISLRRKFKR